MSISLKCRAVSNYIIEEMEKYNRDKEFRDRVSLYTKRLQKILYFCDIEFMRRNNGQALFNDNYNAWPSGPVIPSIYSLFMQYTDSDMRPKYQSNEPKLTNVEKEIIDYVINSTINMDTCDLVKLSTIEDGPFNKYFDEKDAEHKQMIPKCEIYNYYKDKELFPHSLKMEDKSLYQDEIIKLEDKNLQLRYILGGLYPHGKMNCDKYWGCDIKCSTMPVSDDENLQKVKNFISKHSISNATFLRLTRTYLSDSFNAYDGDFGNLILELDMAIRDYNFVHTNYDRIEDNDLNEKKLLKLIVKESNVEGTTLNKFLKKYSLTNIDFMILSKTSINYQFKNTRGFSRTDLFKDLYDILNENKMYQSYESVKMYRDNFSNKHRFKKLIKRKK